MKKVLSITLGLAALLAAASCNKEEISSDQPKAAAGLGWSASSYTATIGADNTFPEPVNPYGLSVSFASSDGSVATIDADGNITLLTAGTTAITVSSAATDSYAAGSASYALTVIRGEDGIAWSASSCTVNIDDAAHSFPTLSNPGGQSISYSSSNESVATIDEDGAVTLAGQGETTITASASANAAYEASTAFYTLTVEGNLANSGLAWSAESYTATLKADDNVFPTLSNPNGLAVSYGTSDASVATIDADGTITLVGAGTISVYATSEETETHAAGSAAYTLKVVKQEVILAWSESSVKAVLEEDDNTFPTLTNPVGVPVSYSSTKESVATVAADGTVSLVGTGSTVISAAFAGDEYYKAAGDSYTLYVTSSADDGVFAGSFSSAGSSDDDNIANTEFTRIVTVTYASSGATVTGYSAVADVMAVSVNGNQVTITYTGTENVVYKLCGSASDGFFKLYSSKKQALWLSGLSLSCTTGAAINNQSGKRTFVYVEGTNTLADASSASYAATGDEDMKGVFFSEGQLIFSGPSSGTNTLTVTASNAASKSGIVSDDYVRMLSNVRVTVTAGASAGHGVKANDYVRISDGTLGVTTKAAMKKGINSDGYVLVEGGSTTVTVSGGVAYDSEDGEYTGTAGVKADNYFAMTGGTLTITNSGTGGKGIRAGSDSYNSGNIDASYISGGTLTITTTGREANDVSSKGVKIGWSVGTEQNVTANAGDMTLSGGTVVVSSTYSEGFEAKGVLSVTGGSLHVTSRGDDAVNCTGEMKISGGYVYAYSSANDALDSNGNMTISGGYVFAVTTAGGAEVAIDCAERKTFTIGSNATVVAYGGLENGYSSANTVYTLSGTANAWNALYNGSSFIAAFKAPSGLSSFAVTAPSLKNGYKGVSVSGTTFCNGVWATSGISGGTSVTLSGYSGGNSGGGPGGGGGRPH